MPAVVSVEQIGPKEAAEILGRGLSPRRRFERVNQRRIAGLARQMADGAWELSPDPIKISEAGLLINGRIRLMAVVESGTTIKSTVIRGLSDVDTEDELFGLRLDRPLE